MADITRSTHVRIEFSLIDVSAKDDSALSVSDQQPFSVINQIEEEIQVPKYATLEKDFWALDGTMNIFPDSPAGLPWGWWSLHMSDSAGVFQTPPILEANFKKNHSSVGLDMFFYYDDWPGELTVAWYHDETLLSYKTFYPDANRYSVMNAVENYNRIIITFLKTRKPYRYLKLTGLVYGVTKIFTGNKDIMDASVHEEINPISEEISINTLNFKLHSDDAEFSIINPSGIYRFLQTRQLMKTYEEINGNPILIGSHYLNEWSGENENTFSMKAVDAIGLMDGTQFDGGMYTSKPAVELIQEIVHDAGFEVEISPDLLNATVSGWIPPDSHRQALQQVAFAIGAVIDTSRSENINVYRAQYKSRGMIHRDSKFLGQNVELLPLITGVEIEEHNYIQGTEVENLFEGMLPVGQSRVTFSEPAFNFTITGGTILQSHVNFVVLSVEQEQNVVVKGVKYIDNTRIVGKYMPDLPAAQGKNVLEVKKATLVNRYNSSQVLDWVYSYHQMRSQQKFSYVQTDQKVGLQYSIETLYDQVKDGIMLSLDTDLAKGFTGKAVLVGV